MKTKNLTKNKKNVKNIKVKLIYIRKYQQNMKKHQKFLKINVKNNRKKLTFYKNSQNHR